MGGGGGGEGGGEGCAIHSCKYMTPAFVSTHVPGKIPPSFELRKFKFCSVLDFT